MGCPFVAVEPVPTFRSVLDLNLHLNSWADAGDVLPYAIGERPTTVRMEVPTKGILGTAHVMEPNSSDT